MAKVKKGQRFGGRSKGTPNKRTTEMVERARIEAENAARGHARGRAEGLKKLGKEVLEDFMHLFAGMAATYQPLPPGVVAASPGREPNEDKFLIYAKLTVDTARSVADFQSPKFKAIMVTAAPPENPPKHVDGNVIPIDDPVALARIYQRRIKQVR